MIEKKELRDEELDSIAGGYDEEWEELKAWAVRHNPEWAGKDPSAIGNGEVTRWLYLNIPEYDGYCQPRDHNGPATYFVNNMDVNTMTHEEMMSLLYDRYGA